MLENRKTFGSFFMSRGDRRESCVLAHVSLAFRFPHPHGTCVAVVNLQSNSSTCVYMPKVGYVENAGPVDAVDADQFTGDGVGRTFRRKFARFEFEPWEVGVGLVGAEGIAGVGFLGRRLSRKLRSTLPLAKKRTRVATASPTPTRDVPPNTMSPFA